ncbi:MAG: hypothetical protein UR56_C0013G0012 [Candidatus Roizmanbacteria bacterium GW2011_GWC2_34_23]|uniref:M23ase beta-sheet core domain-containing protein n=1 Tax=Candidatus Roizmanbacteria bacterium GW2011_GWC2_34_23 TaxID=1618484 RepID=A0A0G0E1Z1_9BACT|nr:MAG: hypothetical protein UR56_C0013G0012 [Candidatus Roizmanbacteria bacterium GW2011_GWC2_34_23]
MVKKITAFILFFIIFLSVFSLKYIYSAECDNKTGNDRINCLDILVKSGEQKVNDLESEKKLLDNKAYLIELQIKETENKIESTQKEVNILETRIEGLDQSLDYLSKQLIERIVIGYKKKPLSIFSLLFDNKNANDFLNQVKYLKTARDNNQKLLYTVQETKTNYEEQKKLREEKKVELDQLEKQLFSQKSQLDYLIVQKQIILKDTQNNNVRYKQLLQQALAEYQAVQQAIATGSKIGPVKKGDPIALVGNSGYPNCSTGAHLHFEIHQNNSWVDPENYLNSKNVYDEQSGGNNNIGSGSWDWPLSDPIIVTQRYGATPWSWRYKYSGGVHTGVDMVSNGSAVIRAPSDGTLYSSSQGCGGSSNINIKYIDHGNGLISYYLHVQ